jgi:hypothetical protein
LPLSMPMPMPTSRAKWVPKLVNRSF